jgi:DNA-binding winged helix-turn-helix (wHTH) protein
MHQMYANGRMDGRGKRKNRPLAQDVNPRVLMTFICQVRDKLDNIADQLEAEGHPSVIETVWGVGYRLVNESTTNKALRGRKYEGHWHRRKSVA